MWIDAKFVLDDIEDCILYFPDPLADDPANAEEEPYVHWHDVKSCISLAVLLASDEEFNKRLESNSSWTIVRPKPLGVEARPRPLREILGKKRKEGD